jgi:hypothetical protein
MQVLTFKAVMYKVEVQGTMYMSEKTDVHTMHHLQNSQTQLKSSRARVLQQWMCYTMIMGSSARLWQNQGTALTKAQNSDWQCQELASA